MYENLWKLWNKIIFIYSYYYHKNVSLLERVSSKNLYGSSREGAKISSLSYGDID